uniref:Protein odr-4 homolog n=1 Tax=Fibrocapsa japonica TaxID=94617 RepID=A0A7S2V6S5_9STRA|mmetsp:Transcript_5464/g.8241  ORF Transcript_5464/g.8241 Transcript_5464/m.8241 type:complete len:556 (+) Transcript_5464:119-1786(+)|eukprot:CAMPEP_0113943416 /NCGR_PEP_ID=MMETSP1339-20121228/23443_1 /TAXON_ID=94617 /ORGANISM="Fibrocapsa japonica" /LENGTH=555 /DNA_ID=CAMNT_0000948275 /DNA_START=35 /DNA_END=1702 /DNA_ORIENTATION=- /assembly_acc=CAM_ASM_000762
MPVKSIILDAALEAYFRQKCNTVEAKSGRTEIGLLIGRVTAQAKDCVVRIIPTPADEGEDGVGAPLALKVASVDWVLEHIRQVRRMLVGGVCVLGMYAAGPGIDAKALDWLRLPAASAVAAAAPSQPGGSEEGEEEVWWHLLAFNTSPPRFVSKSLVLPVQGSKGGSNLRPVDLKFQEGQASSLVRHHAWLSLHHTHLPLPPSGVGGSASTAGRWLLGQCSKIGSQLLQQKPSWPPATTGSRSYEPAVVVVPATDGDEGSSGGADALAGSTQMQLLTPALSLLDEVGEAGVASGQTLVPLHGSICLLSATFDKEAPEAVAKALLEDGSRTLQARAEMLAEEWEEAEEEGAWKQALGQKQVKLPLRVLARPSSVQEESQMLEEDDEFAIVHHACTDQTVVGGLIHTDYMLPLSGASASQGDKDAALEASAQTFQEVLQLEKVDKDCLAILEPSAMPKPLAQDSRSHHLHTSKRKSNNALESEGDLPSNGQKRQSLFLLLICLAGALVIVIVFTLLKSSPKPEVDGELVKPAQEVEVEIMLSNEADMGQDDSAHEEI